MNVARLEEIMRTLFFILGVIVWLGSIPYAGQGYPQYLLWLFAFALTICGGSLKMSLLVAVAFISFNFTDLGANNLVFNTIAPMTAGTSFVALLIVAIKRHSNILFSALRAKDSPFDWD